MPLPRTRTPRVVKWLPLLALGLSLPVARPAAADGPPMPSEAPAAPSLPIPLPVAPDPGDCQREFLPNGLLGSVSCGAGHEPMRNGSHRLEQLTGTLNTYYESGAVQEVLTLRDGFLDGLFEVYDVNGHLLERGLFQQGVRQELGVGKLTPVEWPPPMSSALSDIRGDRRQPINRHAYSALDEPGVGIGLNLTNSLSHNAYTYFDQVGLGVNFALRFERTWFEFRVDYQQAVHNLTDYLRIDIPFSIGMRWTFGSGKVRPYMLASLGADYAWRRVPGNIPAQPSENAWLALFQAGIGVIGPLSRKAYWMTELRLGGLFRADDPSHLHVTDSQGNQVELMGNQFTGQLGIGIMWLP